MIALIAAVAWGTEALTLDEALASTRVANPELVRARLEVESAGAALVQSRGIFDPQLTVDGRWTWSQSKGFFQGFPFDSQSRSWRLATDLRQELGTGTSFALSASMDRNYASFITDLGFGEAAEQVQDTYTSSFTARVTQRLLEGSRRAYNVRTVTRSRDELSRRELLAERALQDAVAETTRRYWRWVHATALHGIALRSVEVAEEALRVGELHYASGELAQVERDRLEGALIQARSDALRAEGAARDAADGLALVAGLDPGVERVPATPYPVALPRLPTEEEAIRVALAQNLDLAVARAGVASARQVLRDARHARLPRLDATASAGVSAQEGSAAAALAGITAPEAFPFVGVEGRLAVPLGNRAARGEAARAEVQVVLQRREVAELERSIAAQVAKQVRQLRMDGERISLEERRLRLAEQRLDVEEARVEAGHTTRRDLLEAQMERDRARVALEDARAAYVEAYTELLRLQGQLGR